MAGSGRRRPECRARDGRRDDVDARSRLDSAIVPAWWPSTDPCAAIVPPGQTRTHLGLVTEAMYELQPEFAESDYRGAFTQTLARFRRRTMLVIFTDLVEQAVGESLLPALPLIVRNHVVVIASVQDPEVVRWATTSVESASDAYRAGRRGQRARRTTPYRGATAGHGRDRRRRRARPYGSASGRCLSSCEGDRHPLTCDDREASGVST